MKTLTFETTELSDATLVQQHSQDWGSSLRVNQLRLEALQRQIQQMEPQVSELQADIQRIEALFKNPPVQTELTTATAAPLPELPDLLTLFPHELLQLTQDAESLSQCLVERTTTMLAIANLGLAQLQSLQAS